MCLSSGVPCGRKFAAVELGVDVSEQVPDRPVDVGRGILERVVAAVLFDGIEEDGEAVHDVGAGVLLPVWDFNDWVGHNYVLGSIRSVVSRETAFCFISA